MQTRKWNKSVARPAASRRLGRLKKKAKHSKAVGHTRTDGLAFEPSAPHQFAPTRSSQGASNRNRRNVPHQRASSEEPDPTKQECAQCTFALKRNFRGEAPHCEWLPFISAIHGLSQRNGWELDFVLFEVYY
jgi:hypothetical protein